MPDLDPAARVAAVKDIAVALLPVSATPREKALLAAELARLSTYDPETIATVWDPETCQVALLPWLAWALSVDVWDATWPEDVRRAVIAAAPGVHRLKGTRAAVQRALDALWIATDIEEWWETEPVGRRGTAVVTAYVGADYGDGVVLSDRIQRQAIASIRAAKPKSRAISYRIGIGLASSVALASGLQSVAIQRQALTAEHPMPGAISAPAGAFQAVALVRAAALVNRPEPEATIAIGSSIQSVQFFAASMEAAS